MADVFISYSRNDVRSAVIIKDIIERHGYSAWHDESIKKDEEWRYQIEAQLEISKCIIVIWTEDSVASKWVREEAQYALDAQKYIGITFDALKPPIGFRELQLNNLDRDFDRTGPAIENIIERIEQATGRPAETRRKSPWSGQRIDQTRTGEHFLFDGRLYLNVTIDSDSNKVNLHLIEMKGKSKMHEGRFVFLEEYNDPALNMVKIMFGSEKSASKLFGRQCLSEKRSYSQSFVGEFCSYILTISIARTLEFEIHALELPHFN